MPCSAAEKLRGTATVNRLCGISNWIMPAKEATRTCGTTFLFDTATMPTHCGTVGFWVSALIFKTRNLRRKVRNTTGTITIGPCSAMPGSGLHCVTHIYRQKLSNTELAQPPFLGNH